MDAQYPYPDIDRPKSSASSKDTMQSNYHHASVDGLDGFFDLSFESNFHLLSDAGTENLLGAPQASVDDFERLFEDENLRQADRHCYDDRPITGCTEASAVLRDETVLPPRHFSLPSRSIEAFTSLPASDADSAIDSSLDAQYTFHTMKVLHARYVLQPSSMGSAR